MKVVQNCFDYLLIHTGERNVLSLYDAETLSKCLDIEIPADKLGFRFFIHGSCNELVCITDSVFLIGLESPIYLWNPSIRKLKRLPNGILIPHTRPYCNLGFGFYSGEHDYKVVRLLRVSLPRENVVLEVEVYSLRSDAWRRISTVMPSYSSTVHFHPRLLSIWVVRYGHDLDSYVDVWVLEVDDWKMIRTFYLPNGTGLVAWPLGIRTNIISKVHMIEDGRNPRLALYDPESHQVEVTGIRTKSSYYHYYVDAYYESLFLLD